MKTSRKASPTTSWNTSWKTSWRSALTAATLALGLMGCQEEVTYSYFKVDVKIDPTLPPAYLDKITTCGVNVNGADTDFSTLGCRAGQVRSHDLGIIDWSTSTASGTVEFTVTVKDGAGFTIGQGISGQVAIVPGGTASANIIVQQFNDPNRSQPVDAATD